MAVPQAPGNGATRRGRRKLAEIVGLGDRRVNEWGRAPLVSSPGRPQPAGTFPTTRSAAPKGTEKRTHQMTTVS